MADNVEVNSGTGIPVKTDDCGGFHAQVVKIAYSADGVATHVAADADGLLVNLGGNNDVTVTSGSVTANAGTNLNTSLLALESGGNLATIAGDTTSIQTAVELIDDTVQVLGTDTYTEATSKGLVIGAVRRDADTTLVNTTNEFGPLQMDANGRLKVEAFSGETLPVSLTSTTVTGTVAVTQSGTWDEVGINDSGNSITVDWAGTAPPIGAGVEATALRVTLATDSTGVVSVDDNGAALTVDNGGTFAVQVDGAALTALQLIDDPVATLGTTTYTETTTKGMIAGALRRDANTSAVDTDNEIAPLLVDANGYLKVEIFDGGDSHTVDGTVTANLAAGTNNIGDVDILTIAAGDNNIGNVDIVSLPASTNTLEVVGDVAHDSPAAGNPVLVAASCETIADSAPANRVSADADATRLSATDGALFVIPSGPQQWKARLTGTMTDTTVKSAPGAGLSLYIQTVVYSIGAATASTILLKESTTTAAFGPHYLEAVNGRGLAVQFNPPIKIAANTLLSATNTGSTTATLDVYGFTAQG